MLAGRCRLVIQSNGVNVPRSAARYVAHDWIIEVLMYTGYDSIHQQIATIVYITACLLVNDKLYDRMPLMPPFS